MMAAVGEWLSLLSLLASIIAGECGQVGQGCELEVARTMANRLQAPEFPATLGNVASAYYGRGEPTRASTMAATALLVAPWGLADGRYVFTYGDIDRHNQGWRRGDLVLCRDGQCVHFAVTWPGTPPNENAGMPVSIR